MAKVFLGVGHGLSDPGAVANGYLEKDLNLSIATHCNEELLRHGIVTLMSRVGDEEDSLNDEIRECNAFGPDLALDIHNNAGGGDGAETFYHYGGGLSKTLAENILAEIVLIGQNSRGAKTKLGSDGRDYYGFIRQTVAPAVIVECAFVDHAEDVLAVSTEEKRRSMGIALAKAILKTLGIAYIPLSPPEPNPAPEPDPAPEADGEKNLKEKIREVIRELISRFFRWLDL